MVTSKLNYLFDYAMDKNDEIFIFKVSLFKVFLRTQISYSFLSLREWQKFSHGSLNSSRFLRRKKCASSSDWLQIFPFINQGSDRV
jgi:hypothetical protein